MSDTQYCSLDNLEAHVNDCFRKVYYTLAFISSKYSKISFLFSFTTLSLLTCPSLSLSPPPPPSLSPQYATGTQLHSVGYIAWSQAEPLPIAWLPILHRMAAAETSTSTLIHTYMHTNTHNAPNYN